MGKQKSDPQRNRNAGRSRDQILEAGAILFSQQGFGNTSVQQIADAANMARGTPNYFFGSKEELFKAVLERESQVASAVVPKALAEIGVRLGAKIFPEATIGALVDAQLDFTESHARFFRLLQWTALENPHLIDGVKAHQQAFDLAQQTVQMVYGKNINTSEIKQMVVSILGATTFLAFFGETTSQALGIDPNNKNFKTARRSHLKRMLMAVYTHDKNKTKEK